MKGIVFTEFMELAEAHFGLEVVDTMIDKAHLTTQGAYTSVGTYDHNELIKMINSLSELTGETPRNLTIQFGRHLFGRFYQNYQHFFKDVDSSFNFLSTIENYIHPEVLKLYPDAQLPRFQVTQMSEKVLEVIYTSARPFGDLAEGLILGCIELFQEKIFVKREDSFVDGQMKVVFTLEKE